MKISGTDLPKILRPVGNINFEIGNKAFIFYNGRTSAVFFCAQISGKILIKEIGNMAKEQSVGVRELARQIGCSHVLLLRLIKDGRMPQNKDGTIPLNAGLAAYENRKNTKPKKNAETKKGDEPKRRGRKPKEKELPEDPSDDDSPEVEKPPKLTSEKLISARDLTTQFNKARLAEKTYQAKLKEIEFRLKKGTLLERDDVEADASRTAAEVRERLTSIPVRVSALCERKTAREIEEVLTDAIQDALVSLSKSKFVKGESQDVG